MPTENTTGTGYSDKCLILDGAAYQHWDGGTQLKPVPAYDPNVDERAAYGQNVLITAPDEVTKQRFIVNDDERIWVAGYGKLVRISHLQRPDYFPSTQVWKLEEDCSGMTRFMGEVMLFTDNTATLISGSTPNWTLPDKYLFKRLPGGYGCSSSRSIAQGDNAVYWANKSGVYRYRYLPSGYSIPECVSEFILEDGHTRSVKAILDGVSDWSVVHAQFYDHEYRLYIGNKQVMVFNTIESTWTLYEYDKDFSCSLVSDNTLYYAENYLYHMDYPYAPLSLSNDGLSDDGVAIDQVLKSKFFDFSKASNKKKFKKFYLTLYSELISYNITLNVNLDNEYMVIPGEIVNKVSRWGAFSFGDRITTKRTNLNYPIKLHHKGKRYNIQYELKCSGLNMAFLIKSIELLFKMKELR
jgi:hypothetical protein